VLFLQLVAFAGYDDRSLFGTSKVPNNSVAELGAELPFDVIIAAYERTSLIVTTNLSFENWTEVLGSERLSYALRSGRAHRRCSGHYSTLCFLHGIQRRLTSPFSGESVTCAAKPL
jgi:hypothetical protein